MILLQYIVRQQNMDKFRPSGWYILTDSGLLYFAEISSSDSVFRTFLLLRQAD